MNKFKRVIGIGWDVGGWMGHNHGVAICEWKQGEQVVQWMGVPAEISIPHGGLLTFENLAAAVDPELNVANLEDTLIVIGVDAPLGFPAQFTRLLAGETPAVIKPTKEIENGLAYRFTDQEIYRIFGKKPLSASFDRIGNNSSAAIIHTRNWEQDFSFKLYPMRAAEPGDDRIIIEVYPALVKAQRFLDAHPGLAKHLPSIQPGTDAYDACLCALYALAFATGGELLPRLQGPPQDHYIKDEGWIYYFDPESIKKLIRG